MKQAHFDALRIGDIVMVTMGSSKVYGRVKYKTQAGARLIPISPVNQKPRPGEPEFSASQGRMQMLDFQRQEVDQRIEADQQRRLRLAEKLQRSFSHDQIEVLADANADGLSLSQVLSIIRTGSA